MTIFRRKTCEKCGKRYFLDLEKCPECEELNRDADFYEKNRNFISISSIKNLLLFFIGWLGFQIIGNFLGIIFAIVQTQNQEDPSSVNLTYTLISNLVTYFIVFIGLFAVIFTDLKEIWRKNKPGLNILIGLICGMVLVGFSFLTSVIFKSSANKNQSAIENILKVYPLPSFIFIVLIGPICEELTYRLGLFTFFKKINRWLPYVLTTLIFAFIHFDFESIFAGNPEALIIELINLPDYLIAGLTLSFVYDKFGLGASTIGHITNNLISFLLIVLAV